MKIAILLFGVFVAARSSPVLSNEVQSGVLGNLADCTSSSDLSLCLKEHALKVTERLSGVRHLKLSDSLTFINTGDVKKGRSLDVLSSEPEERKLQVSQRLWDSAAELLQNTELEFSYGGSDDEESRAIGDVNEGRGKKKQVKKKLKMLIPLAIIAKIKARALAVAFLGVIALSIFKIASILKFAFVAKVVAILKTLLQHHGGHEEHVSYSAPHHEEHHHSVGGYDANAHSSGWSRSSNDAQDMAYAAYRQ